MRNYKRKSIFIILAVLTVWIAVYTISHADSFTKVYWIIRNTEDNDATIQVGTQQVLYDNILDTIDLENLEIMPQNINSHYSYISESSDLQTLTVDLRRYLLRRGYAQLVNPDIAPKEEQAAQQQAQENQLGIWASIDPKTSSSPKHEGDTKTGTEEKDATVPAWIEKVKGFVITNGSHVMSFLGGCGLLSLLAGMIIRQIRTRKKVVYLGGGNASGKSTLLRYLLNPDASNADLLNQSPSLTLTKEQTIRDVENKRLTIKVDLLDAPGHELQYAIDQLVLTQRKKISKKKYIIIIVAAPTKEYRKAYNKIDADYIEEQLQSISKFWSSLLKAKKIITPESVVLFINKLDLYKDPEEIRPLFTRHTKNLEKICRDSKIKFSCIYGSVLNKSGMTELMQVIKRR